MEKKSTIAATMKQFMESGPTIKAYPTYRALNDAVGACHGLPAGKVQALAGPKAWMWTADETTGKWRLSTADEVEAKAAKAAGKNHGTRAAKVLSDEERAALEAQIAALRSMDGAAATAVAPLLASLVDKLQADDTARKGSLKDRLQTAIERLGLADAVEYLEAL
jgi:predicted ribonuclease toxin of YeeF-YezG toxin-antitoxin module